MRRFYIFLLCGHLQVSKIIKAKDLGMRHASDAYLDKSSGPVV